MFLERQTQTAAGPHLIDNPGWLFRLTTVATLTSGTAALMWLSDYITARGISNGMFLMVLAGLLVGLPRATSLLSNPGHAGLTDSSTVLALRVVAGIGVVAVTSHFYRRAIQFEPLP